MLPCVTIALYIYIYIVIIIIIIFTAGRAGGRARGGLGGGAEDVPRPERYHFMSICYSYIMNT